MTKKRAAIIIIITIALLAVGVAAYVYMRPTKNNDKPETKSAATTDPNIVMPDVITLQGVLDNRLTAKATQAFAAKEVHAIFLHTIRAQLPDKPGHIVSYTTWLAKPDRSHYIRTGQLIKHPDGIWKMDFRDPRDLRQYPLVIVTSETKDDARPETEILVGQFQKPTSN